MVRKSTETAVTLAAWAVWAYLVAPMVTLLLWVMGVRIMLVQQVKLSGVSSLQSVMENYFTGLAVIGLVLWMWNLYNRRRFGDEDRRQFAPAVAVSELAGK